MDIHIRIETDGPPSGTIRCGNEPGRPFTGWLQLLHELGVLLDPQDAEVQTRQ